MGKTAPRAAIRPGTNFCACSQLRETEHVTPSGPTEKGKERGKGVRSPPACSSLTTHNTFGPDAPITDDGRTDGRCAHLSRRCFPPKH